MRFWKSYVCSNQLDVQETNFSFAQFNRIRRDPPRKKPLFPLEKPFRVPHSKKTLASNSCARLCSTRVGWGVVVWLVCVSVFVCDCVCLFVCVIVRVYFCVFVCVYLCVFV